MNALAQMAQTLTRSHEDLPHRETRERPSPKRDAVFLAVDRTWRSRDDLCRITGASKWTVNDAIEALVKEGLVEVLPATPARKRPNQYRRAR